MKAAQADLFKGADEAYAASFVRWAIDTKWGVEGRDDQDETANLAIPSPEATNTQRTGEGAGGRGPNA